MRILSSLIVGCFAILCGCAYEYGMKLSTGKGDAGQFILQQAILCGARPTSTNGLPVIAGRWHYSVDDEGAIIQLPRQQFPEVQQFLQQVFGVPDQEPIETESGDGKLGWYTARKLGIGLQFGYNSKCTHVIVLRPRWVHKVMENTIKSSQEQK